MSKLKRALERADDARSANVKKRDEFVRKIEESWRVTQDEFHVYAYRQEDLTKGPAYFASFRNGTRLDRDGHFQMLPHQIRNEVFQRLKAGPIPQRAQFLGSLSCVAPHPAHDHDGYSSVDICISVSGSSDTEKAIEFFRALPDLVSVKFTAETTEERQ